MTRYSKKEIKECIRASNKEQKEVVDRNDKLSETSLLSALERDSLEKKLAKWIATQHETAGWERKLLNFVENEVNRTMLFAIRYSNRHDRAMKEKHKYQVMDLEKKLTYYMLCAKDREDRCKELEYKIKDLKKKP